MLKKWLLGATNIVKMSDKSKYVYCSYGMVFYGAGSRSFGNAFARKVGIFGIDNSLPSQTDYHKSNFSVLGEGRTDNINGSLGTAEKKLSITISKAKTKFCLILHYNGGSS